MFWFPVTSPAKDDRYGHEYINIQHVHKYHPYIHVWRALEARSSCLHVQHKSAAKERLASLFSKKFWRRNEQLLVEGTPAKELHVVAQGDVSIILGGKAPGGGFFATTGSEFCYTLLCVAFFSMLFLEETILYQVVLMFKSTMMLAMYYLY